MKTDSEKASTLTKKVAHGGSETRPRNAFAGSKWDLGQQATPIEASGVLINVSYRSLYPSRTGMHVPV